METVVEDSDDREACGTYRQRWPSICCSDNTGSIGDLPLRMNRTSEVLKEAMEEIFEGYKEAIVIGDLLIRGSAREENDASLKYILDLAREIKI